MIQLILKWNMSKPRHVLLSFILTFSKYTTHHLLPGFSTKTREKKGKNHTEREKEQVFYIKNNTIPSHVIGMRERKPGSYIFHYHLSQFYIIESLKMFGVDR